MPKEDLERTIEERQKAIAVKLGSMVAQLVYMGLSRLTDILSEEWEREVSMEESLAFLNKHPDLLNFDLIDNAIAQDWKVKVLLNSAISIGGFILRQFDEWEKELEEKRGEILLEMARNYRTDLYELLKTNENILNFFADYITYKLAR